MRVLGLSYDYHDSAAAILIEGEIIAAAQEERFSRIKNDSAFPIQSLLFCLSKAQLKISDLDSVVFYEKPLLKLDRILETHLSIKKIAPRFFVDSFLEGTQKTLLMRTSLEKKLKKIDPHFDLKKLLFSEHHLSHAASAFYPSPFEEAAVLTMDGLGEWASVTTGLGKNSNLSLLKEIHYPNSLGLFYSALTAFCGFRVNSGEYKLMGLAPYGKPSLKTLFLSELITLVDDGSFLLNPRYFDFKSTQQMYTQKLEKLLGVPPRRPETKMDPIYTDIAASTQETLNEAVLNITRSLANSVSSRNLCLAGGVALNCVTNSKIKEQGLFKNIWVQPASGDAGGALGAALAATYLHHHSKRILKNKSDGMKYALLGPEYNSSQMELSLKQWNLSYELLSEQDLINKAVEALCLQKSIGWFQGRMEFGPRALGARSILADPRDPSAQKRINLQIKFRESFRPFAPLVLREKMSEWFEGLVDDSPYMLFVDRVLSRRTPENSKSLNNDGGQIQSMSSQIPAVTHLDNTARLQTLTHEQNPRLHKLLCAFEKKTGCPVLVNTSFNVRGEPIVESPSHAIHCFLKTDIDCLAIGDFWVTKENNLQLKINQKFDFPLD